MSGFEVPDPCMNTFYCEKCSYLPFCSLIEKTNQKVPSASVISQFTYDLPSSYLQYFKKWVRSVNI